MGAAENKRLVRLLYGELSRGNSRPFLDSMADDIRWNVIGTTKFSGVTIGKQNAAARSD